MATVNEHDFLAETKTAMVKLCANYQPRDESVLPFDPTRHTLADLFTDEFMKLYSGDPMTGCGSFLRWRDMCILQIVTSCLEKRTDLLYVTNAWHDSQIIIENDSVKKPGILELTQKGTWLFSIGDRIYPEFIVDEIFDEKKGKWIMDEIYMKENMMRYPWMDLEENPN